MSPAAQFQSLMDSDDVTLAARLRGMPMSTLIAMMSSATAMMAIVTDAHDLGGEELEAMAIEIGLERFVTMVGAEIDRRLPMPSEVS